MLLIWEVLTQKRVILMKEHRENVALIQVRLHNQRREVFGRAYPLSSPQRTFALPSQLHSQLTSQMYTVHCMQTCILTSLSSTVCPTHVPHPPHPLPLSDNVDGPLRSFQRIRTGDEIDLQSAVALEGPISMAADVQHNTFRVGEWVWLQLLQRMHVVCERSSISEECTMNQTVPPKSLLTPC